jgi:adenosyl cobinamide kinase/adenosyl cobinamide phosphate guanylyltransferase
MHTYIIGATRSGKSNYLLSLIEETESPFCFIDKHGTAARQIADA